MYNNVSNQYTFNNTTSINYAFIHKYIKQPIHIILFLPAVLCYLLSILFIFMPVLFLSHITLTSFSNQASISSSSKTSIHRAYSLSHMISLNQQMFSKLSHIPALLRELLKKLHSNVLIACLA